MLSPCTPMESALSIGIGRAMHTTAVQPHDHALSRERRNSRPAEAEREFRFRSGDRI